jgi:exodeoxyribonuclease VIII
VKPYSEIDALNWSTLKLMDGSPKRAKHLFDNPDEMVDKPAYVSGRAVHCAVLEPDEFDCRYVVEPDFAQMARNEYGNLRTKSAQNYRDELSKEWNESTQEDAERISQDDHDMAMRCAEAVRSNKHCVELMRGAIYEQVVLWETRGIKCKGRLDILTDRVVDLKFTRRDNLHDIDRDAAQFLYHGQVAWYHDGAVKAGMIGGDKLPAMIAVHASHKNSFVDIAILDMNLSPGTMEYGRGKYRSLLSKYIGCKRAGYWPGMAEHPIPWELPEWVLQRDMEEVTDD